MLNLILILFFLKTPSTNRLDRIQNYMYFKYVGYLNKKQVNHYLIRDVRKKTHQRPAAF